MVSFKLSIKLYKDEVEILEFDPESIESTYPEIVREGAFGQLQIIHQKIYAKIKEVFI